MNSLSCHMLMANNCLDGMNFFLARPDNSMVDESQSNKRRILLCMYFTLSTILDYYQDDKGLRILGFISSYLVVRTIRYRIEIKTRPAFNKVKPKD